MTQQQDDQKITEQITEQIRELYNHDEDLSYSNMDRKHSALFRTAIRQFGSWRGAIEAAALPYDGIRRYKSWTSERIIKRIQELHKAGEDLSWRHISTEVDPQLAAAATRLNSFGSWRNAIESAGLDYDAIRRYKDWDEDRILEDLRSRQAQGQPLNAGEVCVSDTALITAARRTFGRGGGALEAAGLDAGQIRKRAPGQRRSRRNQRQAAA